MKSTTLDTAAPNPWQCIGKHGFENPKQAREVAHRMARKSKGTHSYRCDVCHLWHVGQGMKRLNWHTGGKMKHRERKRTR